MQRATVITADARGNNSLDSVTVAKENRGFWGKLPKRVLIGLGLLFLLLVGLRLAAPYLVRDYVNKQLGKRPDYSGHVRKVRMNLYRGAYSIEQLKLEKRNGDVAEPFIYIPSMDLSVHWKELLHGSVVGIIQVDQPEINFANGPTEKQQQTGMDKDWKKTLESLFPLKINRFEIHNARIHYLDPYREPKVDIYINNLFATATNLSNARVVGKELPAGLLARGKTIGNGDFNLELHINPLAETPSYKLTASLTNVDLVAMNDFMRGYGNFDVASGKFALYTEVASAEGKYEGYLKPFFFDLKIFEWQKERKKDILQIFWEAIVAGVSEIFRNHPHDQLATRIPISGTYEKGSQVNIWATISGVLRNAFVRALLPKIDESVSVENAKAVDKKKAK